MKSIMLNVIFSFVCVNLHTHSVKRNITGNLSSVI